MISANMKFVTFDGHNGEQIIVFPKIIQHSVMADDVKKSSFGGMWPISGGFVVNGQCVGESISLGMESRGDADTALLKDLLDMDAEALKPGVRYAMEPTVKPSNLTKNQAKRARKKK